MKSPTISLFSHLGLAGLLATGVMSPAAAAIGVEVNGSPVTFGAVAPQRVGGRVLIPLRAVVEALGAEVKWNAATQTVRGNKGDREFSLSIGSQTASVNGQPVTLDVPAQMFSGTTMVPLRFVAEALGAEVEWNAASQLVSIGGGGGETEEPPAVAGERIRGEVVSVQPGANPTITLRANGVRQTFRVTRDTIVLRGPEGRRGSTVELDEVRPGDTVDLRVNADRGVAEVVEAYTPAGRNPRDPVITQPRVPRNDDRAPRGEDRDTRDAEAVIGEVISVRARGNRSTITVQTRNGRETFDVPRNAEITRAVGRQTARAAEISEVQVGDRVRVWPDANGVAVRLQARAAEENAADNTTPVAERNLSGEIVSIRAGGNPPTLTLLVGTRRVTLDVMPDTDIFRATTRGGRATRAGLEQLRVGDQIRVRTDPRGMVAEVIDVEAR